MAEYIKREDAIRWNPASKDKRDYGTFNLDDAYETGYEDKIKQIEQIPAADVVEVVRCRDCKHWYEDADCGMSCDFTDMSQPDDGFCNWGERRTKNG